MSCYCGIDLGARHSHFCLVDEPNGAVIAQRRVPNDTELILRFLKEHGPDVRIAVESTFNWYWLVDTLQDHGYDVILAHTLGLKAITAAKVKTDKRDARTLAQLHRLGAIPEGFIYPREQREFRDLLRRRQQLVTKRGDEYGGLRRLLMRHGRLDHSRASITQVTAADLAEIFDDSHVLVGAVQHLERVELYSKQIAALEARVEMHTKAHLAEDLELLETLPGVAKVLGLTILYETGPVTRFPSASNYSSYCRVVPGAFISGSINRRRGAPSKQGNPYLKWAFNQAALHAVRNYVVVRRCFEKHLAAHAGRPGKVIAYNTIAHKLAVAAFCMLRDRTRYDSKLAFGE